MHIVPKEYLLSLLPVHVEEANRQQQKKISLFWGTAAIYSGLLPSLPTFQKRGTCSHRFWSCGECTLIAVCLGFKEREMSHLTSSLTRGANIF